MNEYLKVFKAYVVSWIWIVQYQITMQQGSSIITNNTLALRPANSSTALLTHIQTHQQALKLQHDSLSEVWEKNLEACPLLSMPISVQVPLETQKLLDMAFVGHSSLSLPLTSVLKDSSLKW